MPAARRPVQVFVIRTWSEPSGDGLATRGQVDHPASGRRRYFSNFGDLCDFIATVGSDPDPAPPPVDGPGTVGR